MVLYLIIIIGVWSSFGLFTLMLLLVSVWTLFIYLLPSLFCIHLPLQVYLSYHGLHYIKGQPCVSERTLRRLSGLLGVTQWCSCYRVVERCNKKQALQPRVHVDHQSLIYTNPTLIPFFNPSTFLSIPPPHWIISLRKKALLPNNRAVLSQSGF